MYLRSEEIQGLFYGLFLGLDHSVPRQCSDTRPCDGATEMWRASEMTIGGNTHGGLDREQLSIDGE